MPETLETELFGVLAAVGAAGVEHLADVLAGLRERDVLGDAERLAAVAGPLPPAVDLALPRVVGGERERLVAVVAREQVAQVPGAVGDVDLRIRQVALLEPRAAGLSRDVVGR